MRGGIEEYISVVVASAVTVGVAFVDFVESVAVVVGDNDVVAAVVNTIEYRIQNTTEFGWNYQNMKSE